MLDDTKPTPEQEAPISNEASQAGLGITDLRIFKEVIDIASARGAFKADEFATIGDAYGRLSTFLRTIDNANAETAETATDDKADDKAPKDKKPSKTKKKDKE
jgi:hypothetical protein